MKGLAVRLDWIMVEKKSEYQIRGFRAVLDGCILYLAVCHVGTKPSSCRLPTNHTYHNGTSRTILGSRKGRRRKRQPTLHPPFPPTSHGPKHMNGHAIHNITPRPTLAPRIGSLDFPGSCPKTDTVALLQRLDKLRRLLASEIPVRGRQVAAFGTIVAPRADDFSVVRRVIFRDAER